MFSIALIWIACAVYWLWIRRNTKATEPPLLPGAWPILGHLPLVLTTDSCELWKRLNNGAKQCSDLGGVVSANFMVENIYFVTDPDDCLTVATQCMEKSTHYRFAKDVAGFITARYSKWKPHRKLLNPAFSQTLLDTFIGVFNSQSRKLVKDFEKEAGKGLFDHWEYLRHNALESISLTSLGIDYTDPNFSSEYLNACNMAFKTLRKRCTKIWWYKSSFFAWSKLKKEMDYYVNIMHTMSHMVIQNRKSMFIGNKCPEINIRGTKFKPFIDLLLELALEKGAFTDKEMREHVDTLLVAGHDTTADVLLFTLMLLGSYPEVQDKVFAEIQEVLGGDRDVEKTDLSKLVYLQAVLNESMRIYTIAPVVARNLDTDVKLKNYTLSAGRTCVLLLFGVHTNPIWGPDAHEFHPERWLEPGRLPDNPSAFAAFGLGKRNCIGKTYAMMSMKTTMTHLVRRYRIQADITKVQIKPDVVLKPHSGHGISIEKRKYHGGSLLETVMADDNKTGSKYTM